MLWISAEHQQQQSSCFTPVRKTFNTSIFFHLSSHPSVRPAFVPFTCYFWSSSKKSKPPLFTAKSLFWLSDLLSVCRLSSQSVQGERALQLRKGHKFASFFFFFLRHTGILYYFSGPVLRWFCLNRLLLTFHQNTWFAIVEFQSTTYFCL